VNYWILNGLGEANDNAFLEKTLENIVLILLVPKTDDEDFHGFEV
jgi:hypothetical protein